MELMNSQKCQVVETGSKIFLRNVQNARFRIMLTGKSPEQHAVQGQGLFTSAYI